MSEAVAAGETARARDASGPAGSRPVLCLVTDRAASRIPLAEAVAAAVAAGVDLVQIRDRSLAGEALLAHAEALAGAARGARPGVRVIVNRRLDVALAAGLDGAHLGFDAVAPAAARALLGRSAWVGASTHRPGELSPEDREALSCVQLAPIFVPLSKAATRPPLGLAALAEAAREGLPVLAQGGVTAGHAAACIRAGAAGVAVTGAILGAEDPGAAAAALREALDA
jgi:thiamine-phosphate pyrophosphorylase